MADAGSVSSRLVGKLVGGVAVLGADAPALLQRAGLDAALLQDRDARVPADQVTALLRLAAQALGDEALGLHLAELAGRSPDNVLRIAVESSPTVAQAFHRFNRYSRLVHDRIELQLILDGTHARVRHGNASGTERHGVELSLALATVFYRGAAGSAFRLEEVSFTHPAPHSTKEHERIFGAPVRFGRPENEIVFARALLDVPLAGADPALARHLDQHLDDLLARTTPPASFGDAVRRAIGGDLRGGVPPMEAIAKKLHMSPRTLQRRLRDAGLSFQALVSEVRRGLSAQYLEAGELSLSEVAFLVGFSEASTFHRAFKHWTGLTPAEFRRRGVGAM